MNEKQIEDANWKHVAIAYSPFIGWAMVILAIGLCAKMSSDIKAPLIDIKTKTEAK